jgi:hypothetical protein
MTQPNDTYQNATHLITNKPHDSEHNDTQPNDTEHNNTQPKDTLSVILLVGNNTQHNDSQHKDTHYKDTKHSSQHNIMLF